jgi:hypothetical protein
MKFSDPAVRPQAVAPDLGNVPEELKQVKQWILWKYEYRIKTQSWSKIPYSITGHKASSTDSTSWSSFAVCSSVYESSKRYDGLGFVFSEDTPYIGIDLDVCVQEVDGTLELSPVAAEICAGLNSYTELSPSQTGVHIIGVAHTPVQAAKGTWRGTECEVYSSGRYFTFTGQVWEDRTKVSDIGQRAVDLASLIKQEAATKSVAGSIDRRLSRALKDPYVKALFDGDTSEYDGDSSRADMALCSKLAPFAAGNKEVLDAMFRESKLFRGKWDEGRGGDTYGNITLEKALDSLGDRQVKEFSSISRAPRRFTVDSMWDKVMQFREDGGSRGFHPGWDGLETFYRPTLGAMTVMVGVPSSGKSTWIDCLAYNMAKRHQWRTTMAAFESLPVERHINSLCQIHLQKPTYKFVPGHATDKEMEEARKWLNDWFNFIVPDDDEHTMEALLEYVQDDITEFGCKGFVLDPFTELDLGGEGDVKVIKDKLTQLQRFTRTKEIHTWLLAHPTKDINTFKQEEKGARPTLYSAAGAAHFRNKADFGLVIHRWDDDTVGLYIDKVRNDTTGGNGAVQFKYHADRREYEEIKEDKW